MRTKNLFRTLVTACLAVVSVSMFGQLTTNNVAPYDTVSKGIKPVTTLGGDSLDATQTEWIDLVTVGSIMPYFVGRDPNVKAMIASDPTVFLPSEFNWRVVGTGTLANLGGGAWSAPAGTPADPALTAGYRLDTAVQVSWTANGIQRLWVSELTRNAGGLPTCQGPDSLISVFVLPVPTAAWNEAFCNDGTITVAGTNTTDYRLGGCDMVGDAIRFAVDVTGTDRFIASAHFRYTPLGGTATAWQHDNTLGAAALGGVLAMDSTIATGVRDGGTASTFDGAATNFYSLTGAANLSTTIDDAFRFTIGAAAYGKWEFQLTTVTDRISRKSFRDTDATPANGYYNASNRGSASAQILTLYSLPTPRTQTIRHISNNTGW